jgi:hypothetical protein
VHHGSVSHENLWIVSVSGIAEGNSRGGKWSMGLARNFGKGLFAAVFRHWTKTNSPHGNAFKGLFFQLAQASQFAEMAPSVIMMN